MIDRSSHALAPTSAAETAQRIAGALESFEAAAFRAFSRLPVLLRLLFRLCQSLRDAMELRAHEAGDQNNSALAGFVTADFYVAASVVSVRRGHRAGCARPVRVVVVALPAAVIVPATTVLAGIALVWGEICRLGDSSCGALLRPFRSNDRMLVP